MQVWGAFFAQDDRALRGLIHRGPPFSQKDAKMVGQPRVVKGGCPQASGGNSHLLCRENSWMGRRRNMQVWGPSSLRMTGH